MFAYSLIGIHVRQGIYCLFQSLIVLIACIKHLPMLTHMVHGKLKRATGQDLILDLTQEKPLAKLWHGHMCTLFHAGKAMSKTQWAALEIQYPAKATIEHDCTYSIDVYFTWVSGDYASYR
jgi:hypothetical protein